MSQGNTTRKNLGHATAYGYAKAKGYTGTEEEFAELMASYAEVAQDAEAWADGERSGVPVSSDDPAYHNNAKYYKEQAGSSATYAASHAADALASKQNAAASASAANQSKLDAADSATAAAQSADLAASVFEVVGDVSFAVASDGGVSMIFTEEE